MELELKKTPKLRKFWNLIKKNDEKMDPEAREQYVGKAFFHTRLVGHDTVIYCFLLSSAKFK